MGAGGRLSEFSENSEKSELELEFFAFGRSRKVGPGGRLSEFSENSEKPRLEMEFSVVFLAIGERRMFSVRGVVTEDIKPFVLGGASR